VSVLPQSEIGVPVQFYDCDPLGVVWHGHYVRFFEQARSALMDSIDYGYQQMHDSGFAWPVIDLHVRYLKAIRLGQRLRVRATICEWEYRLKILYEIRDAARADKLAKGHTIQVAVTMPGFEMQYNSPDILARKLGVKA
jgi:acyl-CoA thioester hydrolase